MLDTMRSSTSPVLFDLHGECVAYENTMALVDISLQIGQGEKIALVGPSGAGKTTLLRALHEHVAEQSAFVHQYYALVQQLSAFHNVYIGRLDRFSTFENLLNLIKPQQQRLRDIAPILEALGLEDKIFEKTGTLSGGQQQRVAVARAIYRGERILLADEPISSVDPHQADAVMTLMLQSAETVIMSLHAVEVALKFAERIIGLREGRLQFDLPVENVTQPMLEKLYQHQTLSI